MISLTKIIIKLLESNEYLFLHLEIVQMTKVQNQDIFTDHKQSLCQIVAFNHFPLQHKA